MNPQTAPDLADSKQQAINDHLEQARQLAANRLLHPNYFAKMWWGLASTKKFVDGAPTPTDCIRIYVATTKSDVRGI